MHVNFYSYDDDDDVYLDKLQTKGVKNPNPNPNRSIHIADVFVLKEYICITWGAE
jgi:hypothetical protein